MNHSSASPAPALPIRRAVKANGIVLQTEIFGSSEHPAVLLIMGLGKQLIAWPDSLCYRLASSGFRVIRFDNRDIGLSTKARNAPRVWQWLWASLRGTYPPAPYSLEDMAADSLGLLDALAIDQAHIVGVSMGGMIAQILCATQPGRVLSLTSMMSNTGAAEEPVASKPLARQVGRQRGKSGEAYLREAIKTQRMIQSPAFPLSDSDLEAKLRAEMARSFHPAGSLHQFLAVQQTGCRLHYLERITARTLVIHGTDDPLVPPQCGKRTAQAIPLAKLHMIDGLGHDLPEAIVPELCDELIGHFTRCAQGHSAHRKEDV
ncbi:alpha/beta fold hydrolase [Spongiibacter sp. KMU-166]|uniref:Alpha/beta fold hydrolase n=1 Tax=Spongiibacter thalassae TaxID=2721624 RepID=A0ABX1GJU5_9GAMM|nr:alpha/beta hydrolase [Spongiibacter thalassae]NKI18627.1 alpha/beta fold hydrolase [Spongiibacter thalassae]